ncbi:unnamed protein product [Polarella glacialis]|uniref:EamA domain-containing protein n=1 Tax=Polarella glacialis TaxID=89957 RepID=A0A813DGV4_POLGL|nr:unnamed protein product [Polarella glacialis]
MAMEIGSILLAILAGIAWAIAQFGKRYGAVADDQTYTAVPTEGVGKYGADSHIKAETNNAEASRKFINPMSDHSQQLIDCLITLIYLTGASFSCIISMVMQFSQVGAVISDPSWQRRLPWLEMLQVLEGCAVLISVVTIGYAGRNLLTSVACIMMNSLFAAIAPMMVALMFFEQLASGTWFGIMLVAVGVSLASGELDKLWKEKGGGGRDPHVYLKVLFGSFMTAVFWGCGTVSTRYGTLHVPEELLTIWPAVTNFVGFPGMMLVPTLMGCYVYLTSENVSMSQVKASLEKRAAVTLVCGAATGLGGLAFSHSLSMAEKNSGAILTALANGVYNLVVVFIFVVTYQESVTALQLSGMVILFAAVLSLCFA